MTVESKSLAFCAVLEFLRVVLGQNLRAKSLSAEFEDRWFGDNPKNN